MKHKDTINPKQFIKSEEEKQEFTYPMWFKSKDTDAIIRFDGLRSGLVVKDGQNTRKGEYWDTWLPHTKKSIWEQIENPNEHLDRLDDIVDEAIKEVSKQDSHNAHYKAQKIDTITRCKANMTLEQQKAICIFQIDRYTHREKGQNLSDIKKIRDYLDWLEEIEIELENER